MGFLEFIAVVALYLEIAILAFCDYKLWRTMYTPLNMLMLPYAVILFITLLSCGNMGIVGFYYPSLLLWMIGLLLFAAPSYILGISSQKIIVNNRVEPPSCDNDNINMRHLTIFTIILIALFYIRLFIMMRTSQHMVGSELFGEDYCGYGVWGHLHRILHALVIIYIFKFDKKHKYYLLLIALMLAVTFIYGVKSWILIPVLGGLCMRLMYGKTKLSLSFALWIVGIAFAVFFIAYSLSLILGKDNAVSFTIVFEFICKIFVHYVISGIVGWSQDLEMGILETPRFDVLITNIMNIYNAIAGNEYVNPINPHFIHNGVNGSNVRAFFGTIYVNSNILQYVLIVLFVSTIHYLFMMWSIKSRSIFVNTVYFFYGGMLVMGWFEIYFYHLQFIEVPAWVFILYLISSKNKKVPSKLVSC